MKQTKIFILSLTLLASASALAMDNQPDFSAQIKGLKQAIKKTENERTTRSFNKGTKKLVLEDLNHQLEIAETKQTIAILASKNHPMDQDSEDLAATIEYLAQLEGTD